VLVIFYCQQCVTQMVPALSIDRKQIFRFSQILASFFAGIFEKDDNPNASMQGAETLASLYLLYSADSARQKNSVDSFITGTRWLLRLADQFRLIEKQRIKRQERRQVGSALLALEIERPGADKTILKALSSAGTRLFSKAFRKKLRSRNGSDCQAHL